MAPYLLLGFFIAGVLHVFVPQNFYRRYLSRDNKLSVLWAALLGIPLPLCSCGVIPTAIGLRNEKASKGAVASFRLTVWCMRITRWAILPQHARWNKAADCGVY